MKIRKSTFKDKQAWLSIENNGGEYLGTWHIVEPHFVKHLKSMDLEECELEIKEGAKK